MCLSKDGREDASHWKMCFDLCFMPCFSSFLHAPRVLLVLPSGGDELQGIKKGIMEISDIVVINKVKK